MPSTDQNATAMNQLSYRFLPTPLLIGIPEVDAQHDDLFRRLVVLKGICLSEGRLPQAEADALLAALAVHYATEEQVAAAIGMDFAGHARAHREMLQMLTKSLNEVVDGRADVFSTLRYIEYWFERHIAQEDVHLGACLAQGGGTAQ